MTNEYKLRLCMRVRNGRKVGNNIYKQEGTEPSETDPPLGFMSDPAFAKRLVDAFNATQYLSDDELSEAAAYISSCSSDETVRQIASTKLSEHNRIQANGVRRAADTISGNFNDLVTKNSVRRFLLDYADEIEKTN